MNRSPLEFLAAHRVRHKRPARPAHFPSEDTVPESKRHMKLRTCLYALLEHALADRAVLGSEQFVYFDPTNPSRCVAPDAFVFLGRPDEVFDSWKTWERGTPHLAVEIASESDTEAIWEAKLGRYHALGVQELVWFDAERPEGDRIRVWDRIEGDLVERVVEGDTTPCSVLGLWWVVRAGGGCEVALRLARDEAGTDLLLTASEAQQRRAEAEVRRAEAELRRAEAERVERVSAEQRIKELEAELKRRG